MPGFNVSKESVLKKLAEVGQSKAGRPSKEKEEEEKKKEIEKEVEEKYEIPVDELFLPGEMADFQQQLKDMKPEDLRLRTAKLTFENRGLKRWIKDAVKQLSEAKRGEKIVLPPLPQGVSNELGVENTSEGMVKVLKEIMPMITQYKLVRDIMKEEEESGGGKVIEYETPEGGKVKIPAGSFIPGFNPFGTQQPEKKEENVTIKVGDKEITGPASTMGWMYHTVMGSQQGNETEPMVKIKGADGEEQEVPASAVSAVLDLQKLLNIKNSSGEGGESVPEITEIDDDGRKITMPATFYPWYLMQKQLSRQTEKPSGGQQGGGQGGSVPDQTLASVYGAISEMKDTMRQVRENISPEKLGELAMRGLMAKAEEWEQLKSLFGSGSEDEEVQKERIRQQEETRRKQIEEEEKTKREREKTKQVEKEAEKFKLMFSSPSPEEEKVPESPPVTLNDVYKATARLNEDFLEDLEGEEEESEEKNE